MATANLGSVVVAVDGSEESMKALTWALDSLRLRRDGALVVLHVQPRAGIAAGLNPGPIPFGGPKFAEVPAFTQAIEAHQRRITEAILEHALKICADKNVEVKTEVVVGDPKEKICEVTAELKADLLVMGCRALGTVKRMFLGSVSNYCINSVGCPVVVIKGRTATGQKPQHQRCCAVPELWRGDAEDGKVGFEKEILKPGTGPKPVTGQKVTVHCTGYGKDGDLSEKFWSTKDKGQRAFTFTIGLGSVIKGWDEGVLTMQVGEVARITCTPEYGYGASGFPAWGIRPNSELVFEIEVLSAK